MADTAPHGQIAAVVDLSNTKQDFTYEIDDDGAKLALNFEGQLAAGAKRIYDTWHFLLGEDKLRQTHIKVRVIGGPSRYDAFRKQAWPDSKPNNGFYSARTNEAYVRHDPQNPGYTLKTAFHEVSHLITAGHLGPTPPWLTEGLAEYFETMQVRGQGRTITPNQSHIIRLKHSQLPGLEAFLNLDREQWNGQQRDLNYAVAWSLMHYLIEGGRGLYALQETVQHAHESFCRPFSMTSALDDAYPGGLSQLESDWRHWLSRVHGS